MRRAFSAARVSSVFSCSCVVRFQLLVCRAFSVARVSGVFVSRVSGAFRCSGVLCFQSLEWLAFFHLLTSVLNFFVLAVISSTGY